MSLLLRAVVIGILRINIIDDEKRMYYNLIVVYALLDPVENVVTIKNSPNIKNLFPFANQPTNHQSLPTSIACQSCSLFSLFTFSLPNFNSHVRYLLRISSLMLRTFDRR